MYLNILVSSKRQCLRRVFIYRKYRTPLLTPGAPWYAYFALRGRRVPREAGGRRIYLWRYLARREKSSTLMSTRVIGVMAGPRGEAEPFAPSNGPPVMKDAARAVSIMFTFWPASFCLSLHLYMKWGWFIQWWWWRRLRWWWMGAMKKNNDNKKQHDDNDQEQKPRQE